MKIEGASQDFHNYTIIHSFITQLKIKISQFPQCHCEGCKYIQAVELELEHFGNH